MPCSDITGVILAGGRASRMDGKDKGLINLAGKPLIQHAIALLEPQAERLVISANRNIEHYKNYGFPVVSDEIGDYAGPLAGMLSAMRLASTRYVLTVPCDSPLFAKNLAQCMLLALNQSNAKLCVAHDGTKIQPVFALISCTLAESILSYIDQGGRKVETWLVSHNPALADFSDQPETFLNINTPEQRNVIEEQLKLRSKLC